MNLRALHVIPVLDDNFGGPGPLLLAMTRTDRGIQVSSTVVAGYRRRGTLAAELAQTTELYAYEHGRLMGRLLASPRLLQAIASRSRHADVVVSHGFFNLPALASMLVALARRKPWILAPHGSLDPYDVRKHERQKRALGPLWRWMLNRATVWAITEREARELVTYGANPRKFVVPPPFFPPHHDVGADSVPRPASGQPLSGHGVTATFLGRFDVKKGIPRLVDAFDRAARDCDRLLIVGGGEPEYVQLVTRHVSAAARSSQIQVMPWASGPEKTLIWARSDLFVLASDNENFGMAVVEAMAAGVPVVITDAVAVADLVALGGGLVTKPTVDSFAGALRVYFNDAGARAAAAALAPEIVREHLAPGAVGSRFRLLLDTALWARGAQQP